MNKLKKKQPHSSKNRQLLMQVSYMLNSQFQTTKLFN